MNLEDLYRLLRAGHVQAQGIVDTLESPLVVLDSSLSVVSANRAFISTFKAARDETIGQPFLTLGDGQWDVPDLRKLLLEVIPKAAAVVGFEVTHDFPGVGVRTMSVSARRLAHPDSISTSMLVAFEDVTSTRDATAAADILLAETRHRMKNLLAIVRALATQTQSAGRSADEYKEAFLGRFQAVVDAEDLALTGEPVAELNKLVGISTAPVRGRINITEGPHITLSKARVMPVGMILHELTTNAMKHGALSGPKGLVHVAWELAHGESRPTLRLTWREENGPTLETIGEPGFGIRLIEFSARDLGGAVELNFLPAGFEGELQFPLE